MKTFINFLGYLAVASILLSPFGVYIILLGFGCFFRYKYCLDVWFSLDVLACTIIHKTKGITISGYTGARLHLKRYAIQGYVIDKLAILCGDTANHCLRAYQWEVSKGLHQF